MTRELRLKFCLICVNRLHTHEKGYVCQLTKEHADFFDDCVEFRLDEKEFKRVSIEKIEKYGLGDKKGFLKEFFKDSHIDYKLTTKFLLFKPREQRDLGHETHIQKSKVSYGLLTLVPLIFIILALVQRQTFESRPIFIGLIGFCIAVIAWIIVDYFQNKNDFIINDKGFKVKGQFIPWKIILATMIKVERFQKFNNKYLVLITATNEDIEIKLNGLKGMTESIENIVEFYKERFRASNKMTD